MDCNNESNKLNNKAIQKLFTAKLSNSSLANRIINALMTNKNNPNVTMVIGNVRSIRIGFKMAFNKPSTMATIIAPKNPATSTPGRTFASMTTATAVNNIRMIKFICSKLIDYFKYINIIEDNYIPLQKIPADFPHATNGQLWKLSQYSLWGNGF